MIKAFNGDGFARAEIEKLIEKHGIVYAIETGTYLGDTTRYLSETAQHVHTIDVNPEYLSQAKESLKDKANIYFYEGNSAEVLQKILVGAKNNILFFLDAHWGENWPLLGELKAIADNGLKPVIVIHDFKVPNKPELGFDSYKGKDLDFAYIEKSLAAIYGKDGYEYHYNSDAEGSRRGLIYIEPKTEATAIAETVVINKAKVKSGAKKAKKK